MTLHQPDLHRPALPDWPRLMNLPLAAAYVGLGQSTLRERGPAPRKIGTRSLWDRRDLDRWVDALDGRPLDAGAAQSHADDVERQFLEDRAKRKRNG